MAIDELDADILSLSVGLSPLPTFSGPGWTCPIVLGNGEVRPCPLCQRVQRAVEQGVLVVAAAGNSQRSVGPRSPELCCPGQAPGVVTVAAVDDTGALAPFSSRGPSRLPGAGITLAALGCGIRSTVPISEPDPFADLSGTSHATPLVAGALAVLLAHQDLSDRVTARQLALRELMESGIAPSSLPVEEVGAGLLWIPEMRPKAGDVDTGRGEHRMLPVSVAVIKELHTTASTDAEVVQEAIEDCVADLRAVVPELHIDWNSLSLSGRLVNGEVVPVVVEFEVAVPRSRPAGW